MVRLKGSMMSTMNGQDAPLAKRRKVNHGNDEAGDESTTESETDPTIHLITVKSPLRSLGLEISPPPVRSASASQDASQAKDTSGDHAEDHQETAKTTEASTFNVEFIKSPVQLTRIQDLPASSNVDTIDLTDLLGDPLIKECWQFNFLFDVDFVMSSFDRDVRDLIKVKIVHGMWKREDARRMYMEVLQPGITSQTVGCTYVRWVYSLFDRKQRSATPTYSSSALICPSHLERTIPR